MIQPEIVHELKTTCLQSPETTPEEDSSFVCLYGSSVYHPTKITSDVDLFCAAPDPQQSLLEVDQMAGFVRDLHLRYGRKIDEEVPYATKLTYSFDDLVDAMTFGGFEMHESGLIIPKIQKSQEFLASRAVKLRLALNALSTPHQIIAQDETAAHHFADMAETAATVLAVDQLGDDDFCQADIATALFESPDGDAGEMYLGYKKEHPAVVRYMDRFIDRSVSDLVAQGHLERVGTSDYRRCPPFLPLAIMQEQIQQNNLSGVV